MFAGGGDLWRPRRVPVVFVGACQPLDTHFCRGDDSSVNFCLFICLFVCLYVCMYVCGPMYVCLAVCLFVCFRWLVGSLAWPEDCYPLATCP